MQRRTRTPTAHAASHDSPRRVSPPAVGRPASQGRSRPMAKRITERQRLALKLEHLSDTEVHEVLDYISIMESMRRAASLPATWEDELVSLLAESKENERARQAFEW